MFLWISQHVSRANWQIDTKCTKTVYHQPAKANHLVLQGGQSTGSCRVAYVFCLWKLQIFLHKVWEISFNCVEFENERVISLLRITIGIGNLLANKSEI